MRPSRILSTLLLLALVTAASATETESAFYEKDHIRGFISIGGDYRGMSSDYAKYINRLLFSSGKGTIVETSSDDDDETTQTYKKDGNLSSYDHFDDYYLGLHVNIGAQYKQFLTWFDINFMPTQVSEGKGSYDARWFSYGADWMFGWKLFGESAFLNLIPAVGAGFSLLNLHFTEAYDILSYNSNVDISEQTTVDMENRYYSTIAWTFNAELEARLEFDPFSVGIYGGYRFVRYGKLTIEDVEYGDQDQNGNTFFVGARVTWTFLSKWQKRQRDKL